jgi:hypothetical protein
MEQARELQSYEVFAWGHGFVGARPSLSAAQRLAAEYEGARIIVYDQGAFRIVTELGRYVTLKAVRR